MAMLIHGCLVMISILEIKAWTEKVPTITQFDLSNLVDEIVKWTWFKIKLYE